MNKLAILICILGVALQGCGQKSSRTARGYEYTIVKSSSSGKKVNPGDNVSFNISFYLNDTLKDSRPLEQSLPADIGKKQYPPFLELISLLKEGDSAFVLVRLDTMQNLAPQYKKTDIVKYAIGVKAVMDQSAMKKKKDDIIKAKQPLLDKVKEAAAQFSAGQLKNAQKTPSGLQYIIIEKGNGPIHAAQESASVHYIGVTKDGKEFDSSYNRGEPLPMKVGMGQVIKGWDEALTTLSVGTKAIIVIPSNLAYGSEGVGESIPPNSDLLFYIDIVK